VYRSLNASHIIRTVAHLRERIEESFPGSGLGKVATELSQIADDAAGRSAWIAKPHLTLRVGITFLVLLIVAVGGLLLLSLRLPFRLQSFPELIQAIEAGVNDLVFIGIALFFLVTVEARIKRHRALKAIHELRAIAHIIDMHQLTKDPHVILGQGNAAPASSRRAMTNLELARYLDYCSELLALIGKIAALYVQRFDDPVALSAVDQIEDLTTGLSRKIWQKIAVVNQGEADLRD
jgi:hypothetical protein